MTVRIYYQATCDKCGKTIELWANGPEMLDILDENGWTHERSDVIGELVTKCPNCKRKKKGSNGAQDA